MKRILIRCIALFVLFIPLTLRAQSLQESYTFDPMHTYVLYHINHLGFSNQSGKWFANGTLLLDQTHPQNSKVNITIQIATVDTGIPELNQHLLSPLFFDATKYPTATFVSNKVVVTGKETANVYGTLSLHGEAKPVMLSVTLNKMGINPITNRQEVGFSATTTLNRSDYDMTTLLPDISDEVTINIEAEASKSN